MARSSRAVTGLGRRTAGIWLAVLAIAAGSCGSGSGAAEPFSPEQFREPVVSGSPKTEAFSPEQFKEPVASVASAPDPNIELIETYAAAWHSGDYETAFEILGFDPATDQVAMEWSQYEGEIGASASLVCQSDATDAGVYICDVAYSNALYEAVGADPFVREWRGRVTDGHIEVLAFLNSPGLVESSWMLWSIQAGPDENPCDASRPPTPDCARFQMEFLDEWAEWHEVGEARSLPSL